MDYSLTPSVYEAQKKKELQELNGATREKSAKELEKLKKSKPSTPFDYYHNKMMSFWAVVFAIAAFIFVSFLFIKYIAIGNGAFMWILAIVLCVIGGALAAVIGVFAGIFIGGLVLNLVLSPVIYPFFIKHGKAKIEEIEGKIISVDKNAKKEVNDRIKMYDDDIANYKERYQIEVGNRSANYYDSEMVEAVARSLSKDFVEKIKSASRDNTLERVEVAFDYTVFKNEIVSDKTHFEFNANRMADIEEYITQAAISNVIARKIRQNINNILVKDPSGTDFDFDTEFEYQKNGVCSHMKYFADNGNFVPVKGWEGTMSLGKGM